MQLEAVYLEVLLYLLFEYIFSKCLLKTNSALCLQYLFFQEDKIPQKEIVVAPTAFKENPECKLEKKDMLSLSLSHTASYWLKKIVKSHDGLCYG